LPRGKTKPQAGVSMEQAFAAVGAPPIPSELEIGGS